MDASEMGVASVVKPTKTSGVTEEMDLAEIDSDFDVTEKLFYQMASKQAIVPSEMSNLKLNGYYRSKLEQKLEKEKEVENNNKRNI